MKRRNGFVSNSSSSSFVVVGHGRHVDVEIQDDDIYIPQAFPSANLDFGRENENYAGIGDRLVFALSMAYSMDSYQREKGTDLGDLAEYSLYWKSHGLGEYKHLVDKVRSALLEKFGTHKKVFFALLPYFYDDMGPDPMQFWRNPPEEKFWLPHEEARDELRMGVVEYTVDHGSSWHQRPENLKIFDTPENLADFLFSKDSFVANRSDECGWPKIELKNNQWATREQYNWDGEEDLDDDE